MKLIWVVAMAVLLGACASSGTRDGMVYRDGSWYAPATEGRGDYYTGTQHRHQPAYDWPWAWSVGYVPYGGYCPVQYRYCTSFWAGDPFYSGPGFYYPYWYAYQPRHRHHGQQDAEDEPAPVAGRDTRPRRPDRDVRRTERSGGGVGERPTRDDRGEARPRRRVTSSDTHPN